MTATRQFEIAFGSRPITDAYASEVRSRSSRINVSRMLAVIRMKGSVAMNQERERLSLRGVSFGRTSAADVSSQPKRHSSGLTYPDSFSDTGQTAINIQQPVDLVP
jgi:hypothetical protein